MKGILILLTFFVTGIAKSQDLKNYAQQEFISKGDTLPYRILFPENFNAAKKYPVLFFLHGSGERGNDNQAQLMHGGKLFLQKDVRKSFPAIIIFPQCPASSYWSNVDIQNLDGNRTFNFIKGGRPTLAMKLLVKLVDEVRSRAYADRNQIFVGGLSMGGMGTFEILRRKPKIFAAAFSICGGDNTENVRRYKKIPLWIFHGGKDNVVPPENSERVVAKLKSYGADVRFTIYPEANHNSWDPAFAEPDLLPWLFSHKK